MTSSGYYSPLEYQQAISGSSGVQSAGRITQPTVIEDEEESQFSFKPVSLQPSPTPRLESPDDNAPGFWSRVGGSTPVRALGTALSVVDTPISDRLGFKVPEMRGPFDEIANVALQEATRPTNLLFALPGIGVGAKGATLAARAARPGATLLGRAAPKTAKFALQAVEPLGTWAGSPLYRAGAEIAGAGMIRGASESAVNLLGDDAPTWQKIGVGLTVGLGAGYPAVKSLAYLPRKYKTFSNQAKLGSEWAKRQKAAVRHPSVQMSSDFTEGIDDFLDRVGADTQNYTFDLDPGTGLARLRIDESAQPDIRQVLTPEEFEQFRAFQGTQDFEISAAELEAGEVRQGREFIEQQMSGTPDNLLAPPVKDVSRSIDDESRQFFMTNRETGKVSGGIEIDPNGHISFYAIPSTPTKIELQQKVELLGDLDTKEARRSAESVKSINDLDPETQFGITGYGAGVKLLLKAVEQGARTISVFDGPMLRVAHAFGFEPVGYVKYTDAYGDAARKKIDPAIDEFEPDVVVMAYTGGTRIGDLDAQGSGRNAGIRFRIDDFGEVRQSANQFRTLGDAIEAGDQIATISDENSGLRLAEFWNVQGFETEVLEFTERFDSKTLSGPIRVPFSGTLKNMPPDITKILNDEFARVRLDPLGNNTVLSLPVRGIGTKAGLVSLENAHWERFILDNKTGQLYPEKFYLDEGRGTYIEQKLGITGNEVGRTEELINRQSLNVRFWQNLQSPEPQPLNKIQAKLQSLFSGHLGEVYDPDAAAVALRWANVDESINSHTAIFYKTVQGELLTSGLDDVLTVGSVTRADGANVPMIGMNVPVDVLKRQRVELPDGSFLENVPVYDLFAVDANGKRFLTDEQIEGLREILLGELGYLRAAEQKTLSNSGKNVTGLSLAEAAQISEAAGEELVDGQFVNFFDLMEHSNLLSTPDGTAQLGVYVPRDFIMLTSDEISRSTGILNNTSFLTRSGRLGALNKVDANGNPVPTMPGANDNEFQFLVSELAKEQGNVEFQTNLALILTARYKAGAQALNTSRFNDKIREFGLNAFQYIEQKNPALLSNPSKWSRRINAIEEQINQRQIRKKEIPVSLRNVSPLLKNVYKNLEDMKEAARNTGVVPAQDLLTMKQAIMRDIKQIAILSGQLRAQQALGVKLRNKQRVPQKLLYGTPEEAEAALQTIQDKFNSIDFDQITTLEQYKEWELLAKESFDDQYAIDQRGIPKSGTKEWKEQAGVVKQLEIHVQEIYKLQGELLKRFSDMGLELPARLSHPLDISPRRQAAQATRAAERNSLLNRYVDENNRWVEPENPTEEELRAYRNYTGDGTPENPGHNSSAQLASELGIRPELLDRPGLLDRNWQSATGRPRMRNASIPVGEPTQPSYVLEGGVEGPPQSIDSQRMNAFNKRIAEEARLARMDPEEYRALMTVWAENKDEISTTFSKNTVDEARRIEANPERIKALNKLIWELDDLKRLELRYRQDYEGGSVRRLNTPPSNTEVLNNDWILIDRGGKFTWYKPIANSQTGFNEWIDAGRETPPVKVQKDIDDKQMSVFGVSGAEVHTDYPVRNIPTENIDIGPEYTPAMRVNSKGGSRVNTPAYLEFRRRREQEILEEMGYNFPMGGRFRPQSYQFPVSGSSGDRKRQFGEHDPRTKQRAGEYTEEDFVQASKNWRLSKEFVPKDSTRRLIRQAIDRSADKIDDADEVLRTKGTTYAEIMEEQVAPGSMVREFGPDFQLFTRQDILNKEIEEWLPWGDEIEMLLGSRWTERVAQPVNDGGERIFGSLEKLVKEYARLMRQAESGGRELERINRRVSKNQIAKASTELEGTEATDRIRRMITVLLMDQREKTSGELIKKQLKVLTKSKIAADKVTRRFEERTTVLNEQIDELEKEKQEAIREYFNAQNQLNAEISHYNQLDSLSDMKGIASSFDTTARTIPGVAKQFAATSAMQPPSRGLFGGSGEFIGKLNAEMRSSSATLDASATTIQGLFAMGTHPIAAARAWWMVTGSWIRNPEMRVQWYKENSSEISKDINDGLVWVNPESNAEYLLQSNTPAFSAIGKLMDRTAVTKWIASTLGEGRNMSNFHFAELGNMMRFIMARKVDQGDFIQRMIAKADGRKVEPLTPDQRRKAMEVINNATGMASGYKPSTLAQMAFFAPKFFRSQLRMVRDAVLRSDETGQLARRYMLTTMMTATMLTTAINEARGETTEYNLWNVNERTGEAYFNTNALKIKNLGGRDVSLLGVYDSLLALIVTGMVEGPKSAAVRTLRTKASPLVGRTWDVFSGNDFAGNEVIVDPLDPIQTMQTATRMAAQSYTPFFIGDVAEDIAKGTASAESPFVMAGAFLGMKTSPMTPNERRNYQVVKWAEELGVEQKEELGLLFRNEFNAMQSVPVSEYRDLTGKAKTLFNNEFPLYDDLNIESLQKRANRGDEAALSQLNKIMIDDVAMEEQDALAVAFTRWRNNEPNLNGLVVPMDVSKVLSELTDIRYRAWKAKKTQDEFFDQQTSNPLSDDPIERALSEYYAAMDDATIPGTNHVDWNQFNRTLSELYRIWTPAQSNAIENKSPAKIHPTFQPLWKDRELINRSNYYNIGQEVYENEIVQRALTGVLGDDTPMYYDGFTTMIEDMFADPDPQRQQLAFILSRINGKIIPIVQKGRQQLMQSNPELRQALVRLGRIRPQRQQTSQMVSR
tara:strand:- start:954 stop:9002 length:8049 start_codon:yes stop_codon:yes gene_type:complete